MGDNDLTTRTHRQTARLRTHADAGERARKAWAARVAGGTWQQAAQVAGFTDAGNACRAVKSYFGALPEQDREQERELWRHRLELLWRQSVRDATEQRPGAVRAGVAVAQRAAALGGLDEPTRVQVAPDSERVREVVELLASMTSTPDAEAELFDFDDAALVEDE